MKIFLQLSLSLSRFSRMKLRKNNRGVAAVEFAIIAPVLVLLILCGIEFGLYFLKTQIAQRAVNITQNSLQITGDALYDDARNQGLSFIQLDSLPNFICAKAYATQAAAIAGNCVAGDWKVTAADAGVTAGTKYYVAVLAFVKQTPITPISDYLPDLRAVAYVPMNSSATIPSGAVMAFDLNTCPSGWRDIPALNGRTIIGTGTYSEYNYGSPKRLWNVTYSRNDKVGNYLYALDLSKMPRHSHPIRNTTYIDDYSMASYWPGNRGDGVVEWDYTSAVGGSSGFLVANGDGKGPYVTAAFTGGQAGYGQGWADPFDNRQPSLALKYCKKN